MVDRFCSKCQCRIPGMFCPDCVKVVWIREWRTAKRAIALAEVMARPPYAVARDARAYAVAGFAVFGFAVALLAVAGLFPSPESASVACRGAANLLAPVRDGLRMGGCLDAAAALAVMVLAQPLARRLPAASVV